MRRSIKKYKSSVKGRVSPSRSLVGDQFGWGSVRLERWVIGCRRDLEDENPASFLDVAITFAPKIRRISLSGFRPFRCESLVGLAGRVAISYVYIVKPKGK
jgi:hypothetical protein